MRGVLLYGVVAAGMASQAYGQSLSDSTSFRTMTVGGIHLYGVSVYSGYSTRPYPEGGGQLPIYGTSLSSDIGYGASTSLGWQRHRDRTNFALLYSGTYGGLARYSDANGYSQSLSFSVSRRLSRKWTMSLSARGADTTTAQFLFEPSTASQIAQMAPAFDDLAASFSIGRFSSDQSASMLTGAPSLESPGRTLLLGNRVLSYSGQIGLNYTRSSRLSFHLSSFTASGARRAGSGVRPEENYIMPRTMGVSAGMNVSYMVSPRTQLGVNIQESRIDNRYQQGYSTSASGSFGRKMGEHWFMNLNAGIGMNRVNHQLYGEKPQGKHLIGGGSLGFRTYRHTLVGSYNRASSDSYGVSLGGNTSVSAAWHFHRPGNRWSVFTQYSQQQIRNTGYVSLTGWSAGGGVSERLSSRMSMTAQYVYLSNSGNFQGNMTELAAHSVRVSFSWAPQMPTR